MIVNATILSTGTTVCVTGTGKSYAITSGFFCNNSANAEVLNVYLVPKGGSPGSNCRIINALSIPATDTFVLDTEKIILQDGDSLYATSSNGNISGVLSVMDIS